jgi:uncharacterized protein (DUF924 family)
VDSHAAAEAASGADDVLAFWFGDPPCGADDVKRCMKRWFSGGIEGDRAIRERFEPTIAAAAAQRLDDWMDSARGRLALIVVLDQFPRNIYRGSADAFAYDARAREIAKAGVEAKLDRCLKPLERLFFYLPLEHSESLEDQRSSVALFGRLAELDVADYLRDALVGSVDYARQHHDIIARFGRFPHRNAVLGRDSTAEELDFLERDGPTFGQRAMQ